MKRFGLLLLLCAVLSSVLAQDRKMGKLHGTQVGDYFTDFILPQGRMDGGDAKLSDYVGRGKYVLVDFWASWCGPCLREGPYLKEAYRVYPRNQLDILGVAIKDKREDCLKAIQEHHYSWNQLLDTGMIASKVYGFRTIPQIMLFAPDGKILAKNLRGEGLLKVLEEQLKY